jgi:hypothetical protein
MANVLNEEKKQQVLALGRLGWSLRRIEQATGVRRETVGSYLKAAGVPVRPPRSWGRLAPGKPANEVITDSAEAKPANEVITDPGLTVPPNHSPRASNCEPYREAIELGLSHGRNSSPDILGIVLLLARIFRHLRIQECCRKLLHLSCVVACLSRLLHLIPGLFRLALQIGLKAAAVVQFCVLFRVLLLQMGCYPSNYDLESWVGF